MFRAIYNLVKYQQLFPTRQYITMRKLLKCYKKHNVIFIHIPKAAGISVFKGLYGVESYGHVKLLSYKDHLGVGFQDFRTFAFVRNPYERLHSAYNYLSNGGRGFDIDLQYQELLRPYPSFESFVLNFFNENNIEDFVHFRSQSSWLYDEKQTICLDFIGKFESLAEDYLKVQQVLFENEGIKAKLPELNMSVTTKRDSINLYNQKMLQIVNKVYSEDFINFNYEKIES